MKERQEVRSSGEPVTERARIAGVEAGIAAGLVPSSEAVARPRPDAVDPSQESPSEPASEPTELSEDAEAPSPASEPVVAYELPDWAGPPTLQVPRVLLELEEEAAAERGGPQPPPPGGPVWRERQEDWDDTDAVLADLAGLSVTAYEESSSDDPFAYDFLDLEDESSWLAPLSAADNRPPRVEPVADPVPAPEDKPEVAEVATPSTAGAASIPSEESASANLASAASPSPVDAD